MAVPGSPRAEAESAPTLPHAAAPFAARVQDIAPFHVMDLLARARALEAAGRSIVHMEIGEPDFPTPAPIVEAAIRALRDGHTRYTPALGLPALREAIAAFYRARHGIEVSPARIVVTPGASGALQLALSALAGPGGDVLMADPGYPCNRHLVRLLEGRTVALPVGPETHFQPTAEQVAAHWGPASVAAMLASPANPTGTVVPAAELAAIAAAVDARGGRLIVDEIYQGLVYGDTPCVTALELSERVFVVNSFSKYFGMTGWRLGWLVAPEDCVPALDRLAQNLFLAASTPAQYAALAAFRPETLAELERRRQAFERRRDYLVPALAALGFEIPASPAGAFYVYADCARHSDDSHAFALALLEHAGVCVTPGIDFGAYGARRHLRFAYTTDLAQLHEGVRRLQAYLS